MQRLRRIVVAVMLVLVMFGFGGFAAQAAPSSDANEAIERAYTMSQEAGLREEIYQERLEEGESPEGMPKPYKRVLDAEGQPIPETSFIEKTVDKARELVEDVTGK